MNNRIAKKILSCVSSLHTNKYKVLQARLVCKNNQEWFARKGFYILPTEGCELRTLKVIGDLKI